MKRSFGSTACSETALLNNLPLPHCRLNRLGGTNMPAKLLNQVMQQAIRIEIEQSD
jgi:hypothetical protein